MEKYRDENEDLKIQRLLAEIDSELESLVCDVSEKNELIDAVKKNVGEYISDIKKIIQGNKA